MGFLKFLKREKKESLDELDLPPAPPPLGDFEEGMQELPEFPDFGKEELPGFEFPEEEMPSTAKEGAAEFLEFPELGERPIPSVLPIKAPSAIPTPQIPKTMPEPGEEEQPMLTPPDIYPKIERRLFGQEKRALRERPSAKTIYVKVDKFKAALGSINIVRGDLRKSEEALIKLESIKATKDRSFDKMRSLLDDLQEKLIFIDKTLFKGE